MDDIEERTARVLAEVTETGGRPLPPDTALYDRGLLDSMTTVQLIAGLVRRVRPGHLPGAI